MTTYQQFLFFLVLLTPLFPLVLGYKQKSKLLWIYIFVAFLMDLVLCFLFLFVHHYVVLITNVELLTDFIFISAIYRKLIFSNQLMFQIFIAVLSILFIVYTYYKYQKVTNGMAGAVFFALFTFYSINNLYESLRNIKYQRITDNPDFWRDIAILFWGSGIFLIMLTKDYLCKFDSYVYMIIYYLFYKSLTALKNILLGISLSKTQSNEP